jgi:sulfur carrier protein
MEIEVNGEATKLPEGSTVSDLLGSLKIVSRAIAVEINQEIQPASDFSHRKLNAGDTVEVVTLVGGG